MKKDTVGLLISSNWGIVQKWIVPLYFLQTMKELKVKFLNDNHTLKAFFNAEYNIISKAQNQGTCKGWFDVKLKGLSRLPLSIKIRCTKLDYDRQIYKQRPLFPYQSYYLAEYEVEQNFYGIDKLIFRKESGWFAVGERLRLWEM